MSSEGRPEGRGEVPCPYLVVVSAPSGAGKATLCERLLARYPGLDYSVSCTTRPPRGDEVHGRDYFFLSEDEFAAKVADGEFFEHAVVHGHRYGTLRETVLAALAAGRSILMDIDVQGAAQVREAVRRAADNDRLRAAFVDIFIEPPSMKALEQRLHARAEDSTQDIVRRLDNARSEMNRREEYRYRIVNDALDRAYRELEGIVSAEQSGHNRSDLGQR